MFLILSRNTWTLHEAYITFLLNKTSADFLLNDNRNLKRDTSEIYTKILDYTYFCYLAKLKYYLKPKMQSHLHHTILMPEFLNFPHE